MVVGPDPKTPEQLVADRLTYLERRVAALEEAGRKEAKHPDESIAGYGAVCSACDKPVSMGDKCIWIEEKRVIYHPRCFPKELTPTEEADRQRAMAAGEWLPEGWVWDEWPTPKGDVEGAWCENTQTFVWLEPHPTLIHMDGGGAWPGAIPVVFEMVFNRWWHREGPES